MTTKEVSNKYGIAGITVRIWCKKNGIKRKLGKQGVMEYILSDKDIIKFENRKPKGRPRNEDAKPESIKRREYRRNKKAKPE